MDFQETKIFIEKFNELSSFLDYLKNEQTGIGIINTYYDGPGVNYSLYPNRIKDIIIELLENHLKELKNNFGKEE